MINYPNGQKRNSLVSINSHSKRGMSLESDINKSNEFYLKKQIAVVYKKPTPITIVHVDYQKRSTAKITEAYFSTPSTTDYNGVYNGYPLDFEAKETKSKTSFSFELIHKHQIEHLRNVLKQKAIAFVIIRFSLLNETYYVEADKIIKEYDNSHKSLPHAWFKENGYICEKELSCPVKYIDIINELICKENK